MASARRISLFTASSFSTTSGRYEVLPRACSVIAGVGWMEAVAVAGLTEHWVSRPIDTPRSHRLHSSDSIRRRSKRPVVALVCTPAVGHTPGRDRGTDRAGSTTAQGLLRQRLRLQRRRDRRSTRGGIRGGENLVHESAHLRKQ